MIEKIVSFKPISASYLVHKMDGKERVYLRVLFDDCHVFEVYLNNNQYFKLRDSVQAYGEKKEENTL